MIAPVTYWMQQVFIGDVGAINASDHQTLTIKQYLRNA